MPCTKETEFVGLSELCLVVIVEFLSCEAGITGSDVEANGTECPGDLCCVIVVRCSFEELSYYILAVLLECLTACIILNVDCICCDERIV